MQITRHFSFNEMTGTTHREYLELNQGIIRDRSLLAAGNALCTQLLEPIRVGMDHSPLIVHSGYRCEGLNQAVGGSEFSQHRHFQAADFHVIGEDLDIVFNWIRRSDLKFGQLILEGWSQDNPTWIHISLGHPFRLEAYCNQVMTMKAGEYIPIER